MPPPLPLAAVVAFASVAMCNPGSIDTTCNSSATGPDVEQTCNQYCNSKCAFVLQSELPTKPVTMKLYRETPINVTDLANKDCGDARGDIGFYLANHATAYQCANHPNSSECRKSNAIEKDSQENVFMEFVIQFDGNYGPYQMCNPYYGWDTRHWECLTYCETPPNCDPWSSRNDTKGWMGPTCFCDNGHSNRTVGRHNQSDFKHAHNPVNNSNWPPTCVSANQSPVSTFGYCMNGTSIKNITHNPTVSECCSVCGSTPGCIGWSMRGGPGSDCELYGEDSAGNWNFMQPGDKCISGYNFDSGVGRISDGILGGFWYSLPAAGECSGSQSPGDSSGCTWKLQSVTKLVNSTCVSERLDRAIEQHGDKCFSQCDDPKNTTTACYTKCFTESVNGNQTAGLPPMDEDAILETFDTAFTSTNIAEGGCPDLRPKVKRK